MSTQQKATVDDLKALAQKPRRHWTSFVRGKRKPGVMNQTEAAYAQHLDGQKALGVIEEWWFERFTFKLAEGCRYTPDFVVMLPTGLLEVRETKGFWADDAKVKIKVAANLFPFRFVAVKKRAKRDGGGWEEQEF